MSRRAARTQTHRKEKARYASPLRAAQTEGTKKRILEAVATIVERGEEPTYAAIAVEAGVQERTVYRHFPSKEELYEGFWWNVVDTRFGKTGYEASDLPTVLRDVEATFRGFDASPTLVAAMIFSKHGLAMRLRTNDRRTAMFERIAATELPDADAVTRRHAAAVTQLLYSGLAWHDLREYWGFGAGEAFEAVRTALSAMYAGLRRRPSSARPK